MQTYIIAEMAWGHNGSLQTAIEILEGVRAAGGHAIGIHITDLESYMAKNYRCVDGRTTSATDSAETGASIYEYLEKINLNHSDWTEFSKHAQKLGIDILAMCNDRASFEFSKSLPIKKYVISAAAFLEKALIQDMVKENPNLVVRIGGATLPEIDELVAWTLSLDSEVTLELLIGIQLYPTPVHEMHIQSIALLKQRYDANRVSFGLADHIDGDDAYAKYLPALALPYGITSIEKHVTTDRARKLEDFEAALGLKEFKEFVDFIQQAEIALGQPSLDYLTNDRYHKYRMVSRKRIVAKQALPAGTVLRPDLLAFMRADSGDQLSEEPVLIGKKLKRDLKAQEGITMADVS